MAAAPQRKGLALAKADVAALAWIGACTYFYHGTHAQAACHAASIIPPALFSYALIVDDRSTPKGMRALLFFWFSVGVMLFLDFFMGHIKGYYLAKFIVLSGAFWKAVKENSFVIASPRVLPVSDSAPTAMEAAEDSKRFAGDWSTESTQIGGEHKVHRIGVKEEAIADADSDETLLGVDDGSSEYLLDCAVGCDDDDVLTCRPIYDQSYRNPMDEDTPEAALFAFHSPPLTSGKMAKTGELAQFVTPSVPAKDLLQSSHYLPSPVYSAGDMSIATLPPGYGHLRTAPSGGIFLSLPNVHVPLHVQNVTDQAVMWGLKCNAHDRVRAAPICGLMRPGEAITIKLHLVAGALTPGLITDDKLAIDYCLVRGSEAFDKDVFFSSDRQRLRLAIIYGV